MRLLTVRHATTYRYARPVTFGQHRLMLRPRDSHDLRLVGAELTLSPPGNVRWMHDVFGNSVALVDFQARAPTLQIASTLRIERYGIEGPAFPIAPEAEFYPFIYSSSDRVDLGRLLEQHYPDPNGVLARWADSFVTARPMRTLDLLAAMNAALQPHIVYAERHEVGTQSPYETLEKKKRRLPGLRHGVHRGRTLSRLRCAFCERLSLRSGARPRRCHASRRSHARVGGSLSAGRRGDNLIRVAVTRDPSQAIPISGSYTGTSADFLGMTVEVTVTAQS